jgi:hypothetical protein
VSYASLYGSTYLVGSSPWGSESFLGGLELFVPDLDFRVAQKQMMRRSFDNKKTMGFFEMTVVGFSA